MNKDVTRFAPPERRSIEDIKLQTKKFHNDNNFINLINALSQMVVVLNKERQIVYANSQFLRLLNIKNQKSVLGKRPGEAANCIYSNLEDGGCGTSEFCRTCGAVNSILESQAGIQSTKECRIINIKNEALDLLVTATPYDYQEEKFTIFAINDISNEKRRQVLEKIFFHDVLNSAGGIAGLSGILLEINEPEEIIKTAQIIKHAAENMIDEIMSQRQISAAERGELELNISHIESLSLLNNIRDIYTKNGIAKDKNIQISNHTENIKFKSDKTLLYRVIENMVKNALEASLPDTTITLGCEKSEKKILFSVHNEGYIPKDTQTQIFQRSFTTKGVGRGIGTYSMKLLGEKFLGGNVSFTSNKKDGTTFYIKL